MGRRLALGLGIVSAATGLGGRRGPALLLAVASAAAAAAGRSSARRALPRAPLALGPGDPPAHDVDLTAPLGDPLTLD